MHAPVRQEVLARQGFLLVAFDLLVTAVVVHVVGIMFPSPVPMVTAIVLAAAGVLAVMAALVVSVRGASGTSGGRTAPG